MIARCGTARTFSRDMRQDSHASPPNDFLSFSFSCYVRTHQLGGFSAMDLFVLTHALTQAASLVTLDDNSVSVLAMLGGIIGGWTVTSLRPKPKKIKIKVERND